jgi:hypothetical protein
MARAKAPQPSTFSPEPTADPGASAAERQRRYQAKKVFGPLDAPAPSCNALGRLHVRTGLINEQVLLQVLDPTGCSYRRLEKPSAAKYSVH